MRSPEEVTQRAKTLHDRSIVIDGCSFFLRGQNERVVRAGLTAVNFTVPDTHDDTAGAFDRIREYYDVARRDPKVLIVRTVADIERCKADVQKVIGGNFVRVFRKIWEVAP
jgi:microsomal dipeptidase-like Zn-dependent dipeptidase